MNNRRVALATALTISVLAGCGTPSISGSATTERPESAPAIATSTTPALPEVTFDPCIDIDDAILLRFGLEPTEREPDVLTLGRETIVSCGVPGDQRSVTLVAQNTPWDDIPFQVTPQAITVNGREAWYVPGSLHDNGCSVLMRTSFGAVIINNTPSMGRRPDPTMDRCDGALEMAEAIEPLIDDGT
ncbi:DUF3558 domain-containing protein [Millisia brevis]|uniref:DUF3558 domain-containing protein n=1 Tax=Millisia brevis TaxID=264148 RepID=UPI001470A23E|nr:DUF3558 domain-containing protein [Millisia brevis]